MAMWRLLVVVALVVFLNPDIRYPDARRRRPADDGDRSAGFRRHQHHRRGPHFNPGRGRGRHPGEWRRPGYGGHRDGTSFYSRLEHMMDRMFGNGRYRFGVGPRHDPWFGIDVTWRGGDRGGDMEQPWWKGPNVCFSRKESKGEAGENEISSHMVYHTQSCDGSTTVQKCTTSLVTSLGKETVTETYECCVGYTRQAGAFGCDLEVELYGMEESLRRLNLTKFLDALSSTGLANGVLNSGGNITVFATSDDAFHYSLDGLDQLSPGVAVDVEDMMDTGVVLVSEQITDAVADNIRNQLLSQVAVGNFPSSHFSDNELIETASPYKSNIRINTYQRPAEMVTANCQPIVQIDHLTSDGVVHVVDAMLPPVTESLQKLVVKNPEFSTLKTAFGSSELGSTLRDAGHLTLLAPTDDAFRKVDTDVLAKILKEPKCLDNTLKNHILPDVICSAIVQGETKTQNLLYQYINATRDAEDKLFVNDAQLVGADIMATNGVMHIIDTVLIPDAALGMLDVAAKRGFTEFVQLVNSSGLWKEFSNADVATVFIPTNDAVQAFNASGLDQVALQNLLRYHVIARTTPHSEMYNNLELETLANSAKLRINEYSSFPFGRNWVRTAQCVKIGEVDIEGCNGLAHVIDTVITPPVGNVLDVLARDPQFSLLAELVKSAGLGDELQGAGPFTIFAPTNEVFRDLGSDVTTELQDNQRLLRSVLLNHIVKGYVCCAGIMEGNWLHTQKVRSYSDRVYSIGRKWSDAVYIDDATVTRCDITATNGVVHIIDSVLMRHRLRGGWRPRWGYY